MSMKRKFLFYYLNTGNGHLNPARVLKTAVEEEYPEAEVELVDGFGKNNLVGKVFFEKLYRIASVYLTGLWTLIFDISNHRAVQTLVFHLVQPFIIKRLRQKILASGATDIVSFHFVTTPIIAKILRSLKKDIRLTCVVTDPFTMPKAWFYDKSVKYLVFSKEAKDFAVKKCGLSADKVTIIPLLIAKKYRTIPTAERIKELRKKYGFPEGKRIVLLSGGGDGLPHAKRIVNSFLLHKVDFSFIVVCGRDKSTLNYMQMLQKSSHSVDIRAFGFVDFLDELIALSDCVVIKCGASTIMEVLLQQKPVIICRYIHGQERGNVEFTKRNHVGYFIQRGSKIANKIEYLFSNHSEYKKLIANLQNLNLDTDANKVAHLVHRI